MRVRKQNQPPSTTFIYVLIDPRTRKIRYVGKADDLLSRLNRHLKESRKGKYHRAAWIRSLLASGIRPDAVVIDEVSQSEWQAAEAAYISFFRERGCDLVNGTPGGEGFGTGEQHPMFGKTPSPEHMAKIAACLRGKKRPAHVIAALIGRPCSEETRAKIGAANRGRPRSPELRARIGASNLGKKLSDEHRRKIGIAGRGRIVSEETRAKRRLLTGAKNWHFGKPLSREHKAKIRSAMLGKVPSPDHCANISKAQKGKTKSLEHRAKISATLTGRPLTAETKAKISASLKGRSQVHLIGKPLSEQHRANISAANKGRRISPETRAKISANLTGRPRPPEVREKLSLANKAWYAKVMASKAANQMELFPA